MSIRNMSIRQRFMLVSGITLVGFILLFFFNGRVLDKVAVNGEIYNEVVEKKDLIADVLPPPLFVVEPFLLCYQIANEENALYRGPMIDQLEADIHEFNKHAARWTETLQEGTDLHTALITNSVPTAQEFIRIVEAEFLPAVKGADVGGKTPAGILKEQLAPAFRKHREATLGAVKKSQEAIVRAEAHAADEVGGGKTQTLILTLVIMALVVIAGLLIMRSVAVALEKIRDRMREMAESEADLTARFNVVSDNEVGQIADWFNKFVDKIASLVTAVRRSSVQLTSSSTEMAATSKEQESAVNSFGASTNQIAASVQEISATGNELVKTVGELTDIAHNSASLAGTGRSNLETMESTMQQLQDSSSSISSKLSVISDKAGDITSVVTTITKVADQTNLLSVNAAIEAEKAGEYGRGFLVVAQEIRRLADQTAAATLDIEQTVQEMQSSVSAGVMEMDKFADHVRRSVRVVSEVGSQLGEIINEVERLTTRFDAVGEGMRSQTQGADQINDAMRSLNETVQQAVTSLQEVSVVSEELRGAASGMNEEIARFRLED